MKFHKMSGAGNDFVLISGGPFSGSRLRTLARMLCARRTGIGADGLLYAVRAGAGRISVRYFNSDGSEAFCGNGSRCAAWWAFSTGAVKGRALRLITVKGELRAERAGRGRVRMSMPPVSGISLRHGGKYPKPVGTVHFLDTGVPHAVVPVGDAASVDVRSLGRSLRFNGAFGPSGANVDFAEYRRGRLLVRTYERGVEDETLACGTGVAAAAVAVGIEKGLPSPVKVTARSGENFKVWFKAGPSGSAEDISLEGPAKTVFEGNIRI